jgi:hypothetical protein
MCVYVGRCRSFFHERVRRLKRTEGKDIKRLTFGELLERWKTNERNQRGLLYKRNAKLLSVNVIRQFYLS